MLAGQGDDASGQKSLIPRDEVQEARSGMEELELHRFVPISADFGRTPVLPGDEIADRLSRGAIPEEERVPLASDAHTGGFLRIQVAASKGLRHHLSGKRWIRTTHY